MSHEVHGELVPVGGGDSIQLIRPLLTIGRRESCDICMKFPNISGLHAELSFRDGYWFIRDLNSTNGIKVNGARVIEKLVYPRDEISIGKRGYVIQYTLPTNRRAMEELEEDIMGQSLLERAGLEKPSRRDEPKARRGHTIDPADILLAEDDDEDE
jgi:adenylate cyclase